MKRSLKALALASILLATACSSGGTADASVPDELGKSASATTPAVPFAGRVTDAAQVLSPELESRLADRLKRLERRTHHQMVIVTASSLDGRDVQSFTTDLANAWGIGRKGFDDGVVLLVAPRERKMRIAVGYGLEKRLSDQDCRTIMDRDMLPKFNKGDLAGGIEAGTNALIARLDQIG